MFRFNLVDDPWLPCVVGEHGTIEYLGIEGALARARQIRELVDGSPLVTVALHRMLLAILHRCFGPAGPREWGSLWERRTWDEGVVEEYLRQWRARFDLFDNARPFFQCARLASSKGSPAALLVHELASGNNPTLFDHTVEHDDFGLTPAMAARHLVAYQAFSPGGTVAFEKGRQADRYTDAAPMVKGAVALVKGSNLFETLMLNLHCYSANKEEPFDIQDDDLPAWERDVETIPQDRRPSGYLDLLTWQSRSILLRPQYDAEGRVWVREAVVMKGNQFPSEFHRHGRETMVAFRKNREAKDKQDPWPAVGFRVHKALWQDSLALFQSVEETHSRARTLDWLSDLADEGYIERARIVPVDFLGLLTDKAKVLLWRHERLTLPLSYLDDRHLVEALAEVLRIAEEVARVLDHSVRTLAVLVIAPNSDQKGARQPPKDQVNALADRLAPTRPYWSALEVPFKGLLLDLPDDMQIDEDGVPAYGERVLLNWAQTLRRVARRAFVAATNGFEGPRSVKAVAAAETRFGVGMAKCLKEYSRSKEVINESAN